MHILQLRKISGFTPVRVLVSELCISMKQGTAALFRGILISFLSNILLAQGDTKLLSVEHREGAPRQEIADTTDRFTCIN